MSNFKEKKECEKFNQWDYNETCEEKKKLRERSGKTGKEKEIKETSRFI